MKEVECLGHSTIKISKDKIIYIDPFNIKENYNDADIIFITHSHYDHFSKDDILKVKKDSTKIIIPDDLYDKVLSINFDISNILTVLPNNRYSIDNINFSTIPAYNTNKNFHPRENNWVGYIIEIDGIKYYIAGDTDITEESKKVVCDVAFLPIGGVYTMDFLEASKLANIIKPKVVIPIHYGSIVGTKEDALKFQKNVNNDIKCEIKF